MKERAQRLWQRLASADAWPRRFARTLGLGRVLQKLHLADLFLRLSPEKLAARRQGPAWPGALLVGHPFGLQAVGEYLRASAAALASAGVPFHIRNAFDWGEQHRDAHFAFGDRLCLTSQHAANMIHLNANEMAAARRHLGPWFFANRYNIGCWHWELSRFPEAQRPALSGIDELWASSRFMQRALADVARVPVTWIPHPVDVSGAAALDRRQLGLPAGRYLFLTSFDFDSYLARKNPIAAVRAFAAAFPRGDERAALIVKATGGADRTADRQAFLAAPELADPRIVVMDERLDRARMLALLRECDAFVSLHRAEGFGRGLAEAMLLGKPVIATGYSGNVDFTTPATACVVDHVLVPVRAGEYAYAEGQSWADPDVRHAASYMRRLVEDTAWGAALAARGRDFVRAQHGIEEVGRRYRARLETLGFV